VSNPPDRKSEICSAEIAGCAVNPPLLRPPFGQPASADLALRAARIRTYPRRSAPIRTYPRRSAPLRAYQATKKRTIISKNIQQ